jgi:hypothetical protein
MNGLNPVALRAPKQKMNPNNDNTKAMICCLLLYSVKYTFSCHLNPNLLRVMNEKNAAMSIVV